MAAGNFTKDEEVLIVKGKYKKHGSGIYKGPAGTMMAYVSVKGDTRAERRLLLSSLKKKVVGSAGHNRGSTRSKSNDKVVIDKAEYEELLSNMKLLQECVEELKDRLNSLC